MPTCTSCRTSVNTGFARGWFSILRFGDPGEESERLGVYCSAKCLARRLFELDQGHDR